MQGNYVYDHYVASPEFSGAFPYAGNTEEQEGHFKRSRFQRVAIAQHSAKHSPRRGEELPSMKVGIRVNLPSPMPQNG